MAVWLRTSAQASREAAASCRVVIHSDIGMVSDRPDLAADLEAAFDSIRDDWRALGRELSREPSARLAHAPACAPNVSDLGEMLAWTRLIGGWAADPAERVLAVCDDPWMFRHLRGRPGVTAGAVPRLWTRAAALALRGTAARSAVALRAIRAWARLRHQTRGVAPGGVWILAYGHPASDADDRDGYFGPLMREIPELRRVLHVDASESQARDLAADGRTAGLRAWGDPLRVLTLPFVRWRPRTGDWLIRRAAAREGGTGQAAAIRWQEICQERWLARARPATVVWPWENHAWERTFAAATRRRGIRALGYQHSVIGRQMLNYAPAAEGSLPDLILCSGAATRDHLAAWGVTSERLRIGGALRFPQAGPIARDPSAPLFVALPFEARTAGEMLDALRALPPGGPVCLLRDHPMAPLAFVETEQLRRAPGPLAACGPLSGVLYAATTVGLEALLAGLPVLRFRSRSRVALDILPQGVEVPATDAGHLAADLGRLAPVPPPDRARVFAPVDMAAWRDWLIEREDG